MGILRYGVSLVSASLIAGYTAMSITGIRGSGNLIRESRAVSNFKSIVVMTLGEVVIRQGEENSLTIEGDDNLLPYFTTEVEDDTLTISTRPRTNISNVTRLRIDITVQDIKSVELDGVAQIELEDIIVDTLYVELNGTGNIIATGKANKQIIGLNGVGSYEASEFASRAVEVSVNGMGNATVNTNGTLDASVNGLGGVTYFGNPTVHHQINGLGYITKAN